MDLTFLLEICLGLMLSFHFL